MSKKLNESLIMKALDWAYSKAITQSLPGLDSAYSLAEDYLKEKGTLAEKVDSLIRWQNTKAAAFGFASGLGGFVTVPVAIPVNLASVMFVQVRMIAAIAIMNGYDVKDDRVKTMIFACMCGSAGGDILKNVGIDIGSKLLHTVIHKLSLETIQQINKAVGFRLLTKFGEKSAVNIGKAVPLIGAVIGGTFDAVTTNIIGEVAKKAFLNVDPEIIS
ncbi:EcsC family protein [Fluviispira sanaruensis]|uniref:EcsC family protein n=1 Tax=Fluviispira sanaruensis TaxID=2493639 RepID=A0A4V0P2H3_FLUSA|nr:EcsC family protein [Fluviispira sanaruensis]BBH53227.1 EcsC family protein [Fluviispira sanaruensis]